MTLCDRSGPAPAPVSKAKAPLQPLMKYMTPLRTRGTPVLDNFSAPPAYTNLFKPRPQLAGCPAFDTTL